MISVADGSVSELDLSFTVSRMFNDNTKKINTFLNLAQTLGIEDFNTRECLLDNATVKDGYILAEIANYADGKLESNSTFVVLNDKLEVVTELPKLIENQFGYPSFTDKGQLLVATLTTTDGKVVYYSVDTTTGDVALAPHLSERNDVIKFNNGYFYENKIYDINWNLLHDFNDNGDEVYTDDVCVVNGKLVYYVGNLADGDMEVGEIVTLSATEGEEATYEFKSERLVSDAGYHTDEIIVSEEGYYNLNGEFILDRTGNKYIENKNYKTVKTITSIIETDDSAFAIVKCAHSYEPSEGPVDRFDTYEFYIIK